MNIKEKIKKNKWNLGILIIYAITTFVVAIVFHESWRDEAQAWLIARDLNIIDIIKQMQYEGHPALWHLILAPFAKLGLPYVTVKIVSWMISNITVGLILKKAPFNIFIKILLISTMPMLYLYPAIARSYCIIPLAITLIAIYYKQRHEKPIAYALSILLLANTHIVVYGMVGILLLLFYIEELIVNRKTNDKKQKKKIYISLAIILIGLLITTIPIFLSVTINSDVNLGGNTTARLENSIGKLRYALTAMISACFSPNQVIVCLVEIILIMLLLYEIKYHRKNSLIILASVGFCLIIYAFIYYCSEQRAGIFIFFIMFVAWIQWEEKQERKVRNVTESLLVFLLIINITSGINAVVDEINTKYSAANQTAQYIKDNLEEDSIFICMNMPYSSAIIPYINRNAFWSPQTENYFSFVTWDEKYRTGYTLLEMIEKIEKNFDKNQKLYLLYTYDFKEEDMEVLEEKGILKKIFTSDISKTENFIIYEMKQ